MAADLVLIFLILYRVSNTHTRQTIYRINNIVVYNNSLHGDDVMKSKQLINISLAILCIFMVCVAPAMAGIVDDEDKEIKVAHDGEEVDDGDSDDTSSSDSSSLGMSDFVDFKKSVDDTKETALWTPYNKITFLLAAAFVGLIVWSLFIKGIKFLSGNGESVSDAVFGILGILGVVLLVIVAMNSVFSFFEWNY